MTNLVVTSFFEFDSSKTEFYFNHFIRQIEENLKTILFLDKNLEHKKEILEKYTNLEIVFINWNDLPINKFIQENEFNTITIPGSNSKDNIKFHILMNSKIYLVKLASTYVKADLYTWVDFGIFKITNESWYWSFERNLSKLSKSDKIIIPGGFEASKFLPECISMTRVFWRFLGGIFVCPKELIDVFNEENDKIIYPMLKERKLTWEVNIWCNIEWNAKNIIRYFKADHNSHMWGFFDNKTIFYAKLDDSPDVADIICRLFNKFITSRGFCFTVFGEKNLKAEAYLHFLKSQNTDAKIYYENKKNNESFNELITKVNVINFCKQLGWDLNYTHGFDENGKNFKLSDVGVYEEYLTLN